MNDLLNSLLSKNSSSSLKESQDVLENRKLLLLSNKKTLEEMIKSSKSKLQEVNKDFKEIKILKEKISYTSIRALNITHPLMLLLQKEDLINAIIKGIEKIKSFKEALLFLFDSTKGSLPNPLLLRGIEDLFLSFNAKSTLQHHHMTPLPAQLKKEYLDYKEKLFKTILDVGFSSPKNNHLLMQIIGMDLEWKKAFVCEEIGKLNLKAPTLRERIQSLHKYLENVSIEPQELEDSIKILLIKEFTTTALNPLILTILRGRDHSLMRGMIKECKAFEKFINQKYQTQYLSLSATFSQHLFFIIEGHDSGIVEFLSTKKSKMIILDDGIIEDSAPHLFLLFRELLDDVNDCCLGVSFSSMEDSSKETQNKYLLVVCSVIRKNLLIYLKQQCEICPPAAGASSSSSIKSSVETKIKILAQQISTIEYTIRAMKSLSINIKKIIQNQYEEAIDFLDIENDFKEARNHSLAKIIDLLRNNQLKVIFKKAKQNNSWIIDLLDWISIVRSLLDKILGTTSFNIVMEGCSQEIALSYQNLIKEDLSPLEFGTEKVERLLLDLLTIKSTLTPFFVCEDLELLLKASLIPLEPTCHFVENYISLSKRLSSLRRGGLRQEERTKMKENFTFLLGLSSLRQGSVRYYSYIEAYDRMTIKDYEDDLQFQED